MDATVDEAIVSVVLDELAGRKGLDQIGMLEYDDPETYRDIVSCMRARVVATLLEHGYTIFQP